jgi:hypothetical protein
MILYHEKPPKEKINPLNREHLAPQYQPIMVALSPKDRNVGEDIFREIIKISQDGVCLDNLEKGSTFSDVDSMDKLSRDYIYCTAIVAVASSKENKQNISFMTHQDPYKFLQTNYFEEQLKKCLKKLKNQAIPGSIDINILGGSYLINDTYIQRIYKDQIKEIGNIIKKNLGFEPVVAVGPNLHENLRDHSVDIYLNNQYRRIFLLKNNQPFHQINQPFLPSQVEKMENIWRKEIDRLNQ